MKIARAALTQKIENAEESSFDSVRAPLATVGQQQDLAIEGPIDPDLAHRFHRGPPWVRTRVLDPMTLEPKAPGEVGVLAHMDLANLGSVSSILTEDLGREVPGGFQLVGRSPGSEPRGCSLAMEDFLASREGGT